CDPWQPALIGCRQAASDTRYAVAIVEELHLGRTEYLGEKANLVDQTGKDLGAVALGFVIEVTDVLADVDADPAAQRDVRSGLGAVELAVDEDLAGAVGFADGDDVVPLAVGDGFVGRDLEAVLPVGVVPPVDLAALDGELVLAVAVVGVALLDDHAVAGG